MMSVSFGKWSDELHELPDQKKRLLSAIKKDMAPTSVDRENLHGVFKGSGKVPYQTEIHSCTCRDFQLRHKPCKHIYRLAIECGLLDADSCGIDKASIPVPQITLEEAVGLLENLPNECQLFLKRYLDGGDSVHSVEMSEAYEPLLSSELIQIAPPTIDSIYFYKASELIDICTSRGYSPPLHTTKKKLAAWCVENAPDCFFSFVFAPSFQKRQRTAYRYLHRKFDWNYYVNPNTMHEYRYPSGSENNMFPDDAITALLNLYGHNRCINGYDSDCYTEVAL